MTYIGFMKRFAPFLLLASLAAPATAQEAENAPGMIERGAQMFLEGLLREMEPALDGLSDLGPALRGFAEEMGPALADVLGKVQDWSAYHPPEILPNGDIVIRRKTPLTPEEGDEPQIDI